MNIKTPNFRFLALCGGLALVTSTEASPFVYQNGDMALGFRKPGQGTYEMVVDLGATTNFIGMAPGTSTNITAYTTSQVVGSFTTLTNLSWSVTAYTYDSTTFSGYPINTIWVTVPVGGSVPVRGKSGLQNSSVSQINSIFIGAAAISSRESAGANNTATSVQELAGDALSQNYSYWMKSPENLNLGDLNDYGPVDGNGNPINLENNSTGLTGAPFSTPVQSYFYELCPASKTDPNNGSTTAIYLVGYFQLNTDGSMTFTRAGGTVSAPSAGTISASVTNGFAPLAVVFTNTSSGSITNWIWSFGNGVTTTNTTSGNVTNTYATNGTYLVILTVNGGGGSSSATNSITAWSAPKFGRFTTLSGGNLLLGGSNCPAGVQYRILTTTNLALAITNWTPVLTNTFAANGSFAYTNSMTNRLGYFRLVSP